ncbi:MAG: hypothetical protein C0506_09010 [Anaerolinea sp.]|nr:hypothetical protein [Anaerolinea sp.]
MISDVSHEFAEAIRGADHDVDLFGGAMLIARLGGHHVDPHRAASRLDLIAETVRDYAGEAAGADALAHAIDYQLFTIAGFHGNTGNYNDPENSYLDRVIDRKTGLPITLSLVYMEIAQRVGLRCDGVGFPGHFIVRCGEPEAGIFVDPFEQGARLDREELLARLRSIDIGAASPESFLSAVTRRQILQRMLNNLHGLFRARRDMERWHATTNLLLQLEPWNAPLTGERGMLSYRLGNPAAALDDLERYVEATGRPRVSAGALRLLDELRLQQGGREE